jgi:hypothetical protein
MALRHIGLWEPDTPLLRDLEAVARQHGTTHAQIIRGALAEALPKMRSGELSPLSPRRVGRCPRTAAAQAR